MTTRVDAPAGYRVRVFANGATQPALEQVVTDQRLAKRTATTELLARGLGARAEVLIGATLTEVWWAGRCVPTNAGTPKVQTEAAGPAVAPPLPTSPA